MKELVVGTVALAAIGMAGSAMAADLRARAPVYKAPPPVVAYNWTGCYVGGNVGYGWAPKQWTDGGIEFTSHTADGVVGGGQLGCDYQTGPWVFGIQGMFDWSGMRGDSRSIIDPVLIDSTRVSWFATLTGRIGYAVQPMTLLYVKGGAAWVRDKHDECCVTATTPVIEDEIGFLGDGFARVTRYGWTVGAGFEHMFRHNWSFFVEYDYIGLGTRAVTFTPTPPTTLPFIYNIRQNVQTVLVGLNYRFGPGPVVAKY
jgi:outer membrane immunogenic protein